MTTQSQSVARAPSADHGLRREMGLGDLVLAQVLCVVGSGWVGVAAKIGSAHVLFWVGAMAMFYLPLAAVVIWLNRAIPLEGGLYQWAKAGFNEFWGFLIAWNLWVYAILIVPSILFVIPTDLSYMIGPSAAWLPASKLATALLVGAVTLAIVLVAVRGLGWGKWLHNAGSAMILMAYGILLLLPLWAMWRGIPNSYVAVPLALPQMDWFSLAIFGQMTIGGLSGFEYVAIMAGECRNPARTIAQSVMISAPIIAAMFILGTSSVLGFLNGAPINIIGPIPQTFRAALGTVGIAGLVAPFAIALLIGRAMASGSLIFTGLTRLPMTAGWDHLLPEWFTAMHPRWKTPVYSILFVGVLIMIMLLLSMAGVREQEAMQVLSNASIVHYGLTYVALFALPIFGGRAFRAGLPLWLRVVSGAGLLSSLVAVFIAVYPIVDVVSRFEYALKVSVPVVVSNLIALWIYRRGAKIRGQATKSLNSH